MIWIELPFVSLLTLLYFPFRNVRRKKNQSSPLKKKFHSSMDWAGIVHFHAKSSVHKSKQLATVANPNRFDGTADRKTIIGDFDEPILQKCSTQHRAGSGMSRWIDCVAVTASESLLDNRILRFWSYFDVIQPAYWIHWHVPEKRLCAKHSLSRWTVTLRRFCSELWMKWNKTNEVNMGSMMFRFNSDVYALRKSREVSWIN